MTTVRDIVKALLRDFGVVSFDPNENVSNRGAAGLAPGHIAECLNAINGAFQDAYTLAPGAFTELPYSEVLRAPTQVSFTGTNYSKTISAFTTWAAWMKGCTIQISGEDTDNVILSATELSRPLMQASGAGKQARVYSDALLLPSTFGHIIEPVMILGEGRLTLASSREEFLNYSYSGATTGTHFREAGLVYGIAPKVDGIPRMGFVDTRRDTSSAYLPTFLQFAPMPSQAFTVEFQVKLKPTAYDEDDVENGSDHTTDPNTLVPMDWVESVIYPMSRKRLSSSAEFSNEIGIPEIDRQYRQAITILESSKPGITKQFGRYPKPAGGGN